MKTVCQFCLFIVTVSILDACRPELWKMQQEPQLVTLTEGDTTVSLNMTDASVKPDPTKTYYWFRNHQVVSQKGGYAGKLLDGSYQVFDSHGRLMVQGEFSKGLRTELWSFWRNGALVEQVHYKRGELDGEYFQFVGDRLAESGSHKNGYLDGKRTLYAVTDTSSLVISYKEGIPVDSVFVIHTPGR